MAAAILTQERLKELLHYDPETGVFTWNIRIGSKIKSGSIAGTKNLEDYIKIKCDGVMYRAHRLAWLYTYGHFPPDLIDHINGILSDNRLINLREATNNQNLKNTGIRSSNTSGFKGVSWHKTTKKWVAQCNHNGKRKCIGYFESPEMASHAYNDFAKMNHGEFYREVTR